MDAPTLEPSPRGVLVKYKPPDDARGAHAAIHVYRGSDPARKHFLDVKNGGNEGTLLPVGQTGDTFKAQNGADGVTIIGGLQDDGQEIKATVCFRGRRARLCCPEPHRSLDVNYVMVSYAAPALCSAVSIKFVDGVNEFLAGDAEGCRSSSRKSLLPGVPDPLVGIGKSSMNEFNGQGNVMVKVPSRDVEYAVSVAAYNGFWSAWSAPTAIKIADHAPPQCCAPRVEGATEDGVTVMFTLPPKVEGRIVVIFDSAADGKKYFYKKKNILADEPPEYKDAVSSTSGIASITATSSACRSPSVLIKGLLTANTEYSVRVAAMNLNGIGPASPSTTFKTAASEVEITGSATQEDRDVELRKHAWDVDEDSDSDPPAKKRKAG